MVRRDAFLDVEQRLIQTKGYEAMRIQELVEQLEASKGAFYHYFDSKQALLEAVVVRFADGAMASLAPVLNDPELPALTKLERVFAGIAGLKAEQKDLMLAIIEVWNSDGNAIVREKVRRLSERIMIPLFSAVVKQGIDEGTLHVDSPDDTPQVLVALMLGFQLQATDLFLSRQAGKINFEAVPPSFACHTPTVD